MLLVSAHCGVDSADHKQDGKCCRRSAAVTRCVGEEALQQSELVGGKCHVGTVALSPTSQFGVHLSSAEAFLQGKSWDQRWFVLTSSSLTYYRSQEDRDWGAAGTVLSLTSLRRFECLSSLVFQVCCRPLGLLDWIVLACSPRLTTCRTVQLYFFQRILQLRAAREQEAKQWTICLQSIQSPQQDVTLSPTAASLHSPRPTAANGALSPGGKSASALVDGVLIINARSSTDMEVSHVQGADAQGVLPAHLLVEEGRVSYSPLSEHAAASPFLSYAHMQLLTDRAGGAKPRLTPKQPAATAEAATSTEGETHMSIEPARRLNFVE